MNNSTPAFTTSNLRSSSSRSSSGSSSDDSSSSESDSFTPSQPASPHGISGIFHFDEKTMVPSSLSRQPSRRQSIHHLDRRKSEEQNEHESPNKRRRLAALASIIESSSSSDKPSFNFINIDLSILVVAKAFSMSDHLSK